MSNAPFNAPPFVAPPLAPATSAARPDSPRAQLRRDLIELARPALVYQAWVVLMLAIFDLVMAVLQGFSPETFVILAVLSGSTIAGVTIGQGLAIARLRGWFLGVSTVAWYTATCLLTIPIASLPTIGALILSVLYLTPIFVSGGVWSLASSRALFAAWVPVIYGAGAIFSILERDGGVARWEEGNKLAIWNISTALILFLTIALLIVYLVQRERHRLHRWRFAPRALLAGSVIERGAARPRLTILGWMAMIALGLVITAGTLLIAPYLLRTGEPPEGEVDPQQDPPQQQPEEDGGEGEGEEEGEGEGEEEGEGESDPAAEAERAARSLVSAVCPMLIGLLLVAGMLAIAWRPVRRLAIIEWLRRPLWNVSPTTRIRMGWRLVEIGLGDLGIARDPSIDASELVRRHAKKLEAIDAELYAKLTEAARLRDRVAYGLGLAPGDVETFARDAERIFVIATNRIDLPTEAKNAFREMD